MLRCSRLEPEGIVTGYKGRPPTATFHVKQWRRHIRVRNAGDAAALAIHSTRSAAWLPKQAP
ncbi:hypothetical protein GCM10009590_00990 [Brachybacterium alimentarium]